MTQNNTTISQSKLIQVQYLRCKKNPIYFIRKYCFIFHPTRGKIPFQLYDFQQQLIKSFIESRHNIILKSRQMGITTTCAGYCMWLLTFHEDVKIVAIANKLDTSKFLIKMIRQMYGFLPDWLKQGITTDNKQELQLNNRSVIWALSADPDAVRSKGATLLIFDEAAILRQNQAQQVWAAAQPALSTGGQAIVLSCVTRDTFVFTQNGISTIEQFIPNRSIPGDYYIDTYSVCGVNGFRSSNLFHNNGYQPTLIFQLYNTRIQCTKNHKLWTYDSTGKQYTWKQAKNITTNDYLPIVYNITKFGSYKKIDKYWNENNFHIKNEFRVQQISNQLSYLFGYYIGDGCVSYRGCTIITNDFDNIQNILDSLELQYSLDGLRHKISSEQFTQCMQAVGFQLGRKSKDKIIPPNLMKLDSTHTKYMLMGLFDSDGSVLLKKKRITLCSTSYKLLQQVRMILLNYGIISRIQVGQKEQNYDKTHYIKFINQGYVLSICGRYVKTFTQKIGFRLERKMKKAIQISSIFQKEYLIPNTSDVIPNSFQLCKQLFNRLNISIQIARKRYKLFNTKIFKLKKYKTINMPRQTVLKLYNACKDLQLLSKQQIQYNDKYISQNILWVRVKDIRKSQNYTYDFSLPQKQNDFWCHSVLYNGIIGHQTPKGTGNLYHRLWTQAESGKLKDFKTTKLVWYLHPQRDEAFRKQQDEQLGSKKASQQFDCNFLASGNTVIDGQLLKAYQQKYQTNPLYKRHDGLWVWQQPISDQQWQEEYFISADVARGDGLDFSAFHVFKKRSLQQVAQFVAKIGTDKYAKTLVNIAQWYNNATLIVENANIGWAVLQDIILIGYQNLYYDTRNPAYTDDERIQGRKLLDANGKQKQIPGFTTSPKTRPLIIDKLIKSIQSGTVILRSTRTYSELNTFIWSSGKAQAMSGYNDDLVLSLAIALWVRDTGLMVYENDKIREETKLSLFNSSIYTNNIIPKSISDQKLRDMNLEYNVYNQHFDLTQLLDPRYRIQKDKQQFIKNNK